MEVCSLEQQATGLEVLWGTAKSFATYQPHKFLQLNLPWFLNYPQWQLWSSQMARKFCLNPKMAQNHPPGETPLQKMHCPFGMGGGDGFNLQKRGEGCMGVILIKGFFSDECIWGKNNQD